MKKTILIFAISLTSFSGFSEDWTVEMDGITYRSENDSTCYVYKADLMIKEAIIPSEVNGHKVTEIHYYGFRNCDSLKYVSIPTSVTYIDDQAFTNCQSLSDIYIPESVNRMEAMAFWNCTSLVAINVAPENQSYCSVDGVVFNKEQTEILFMPAGKSGAYIIPEGITKLGSGSFSFSQLNSVTCPSSLQKIAAFCFLSASYLEEVIFPDCCQVTEMGGMAFYLCKSLSAISLPDSLERMGPSCFDSTGLKTIWLPKKVQLSAGEEFFNCMSLDEVHVQTDVIFGISYESSFGSHYPIEFHRYLYVPKGCREKYETAKGWNHFLVLEEGQDRSEAGIQNIPTDSQDDSQYYDMLGRMHRIDSCHEVRIKNGKKTLLR